MITQNEVKKIVKLSEIIGCKINYKDLILEIYKKGINSHIPKRLKMGYYAVYIFEFKKEFLKVGKVSGTKNNDRFYQHHYIIKAANSTLARSLNSSSKYKPLIKDLKVRDWICKNTNRYNILIPIKYGKNFVNFVEAFFILKCNPIFEGRNIN